MPSSKRRGWQLLVIPEGESAIRQFRLARRSVTLIMGLAVLLILYAAVETVLFWVVARRAAQVEPLRQRVRELESSGAEMARLGTELTRLRGFEQQLRRILAGGEGDVPEGGTWDAGAFDETASVPDAASPEGGQRASASPVAEARSLGGPTYTAMDMPTVPPVRGYVTRQYAAAASYRQIPHYGLDVAAREGTPVLAAADGLAVFADWTYRYGNLVVLAHRSGFITVYGHNQVLFARAGQRVRQGEPIALVGSSGISTAPHLHFELWQDGSPVDPTTVLQVVP